MSRILPELVLLCEGGALLAAYFLNMCIVCRQFIVSRIYYLERCVQVVHRYPYSSAGGAGVYRWCTVSHIFS